MEAASVTLTQRDLQMIAFAFASMKEGSAIDYEKMSKLAKLKHAKSARDTFLPIRKKIDALAATGNTEDGGEAAPAKATGRGGKRAKQEDEADADAKPAKKAATKATKGKGAGAKGKKVKAEPEAEEESPAGEEAEEDDA